MGTRKKKLYLKERIFFVLVTEKSIEEAKQGQKIDPDLVESIMKPSGLVTLVKKVLQKSLFKIHQFRPKITKIRAYTLQMSGKITDSANVASNSNPCPPPLRNIWPH